jgi:hypothetical protein
VRIHWHGETGDTTSGEDGSKSRLGTVPDWEITFTKASFDPGNNPFGVAASTWTPTASLPGGGAAPGLRLFSFIPSIYIYPGGTAFAGAIGIMRSQFNNGLVDDFEIDQDANMMSPFSMHVVCSDGGSVGNQSGQQTGSWYPY